MPEQVAERLRSWSPALSFTRAVMLNARRNPRRPAIVFQHEAITYGALAERIGRLMEGLDRLDVRPGEVVTLLSDNHPDMLVAYLAILGIGAIPAPINYRLRLSDMEHIVGHTDSRVLFMNAAFLDAAPTLPGKVEHMVVFGADADQPLPSNALPIGWLLAETRGLAPDLGRSHCMSLLHTSGTTGRPKGALRANWGMEERAIEQGFATDDRMLCVMPICLSAGYGYTLLPLYLGATAYLEREIDAERIVELIVREAITSTFMIPSILQRILDHPKVGALDKTAMRLIQSGAGALSMELRQEVVGRFGPILGIYAGSTEAGPYTNYKGPDVLRKSTGNCIGKPFFGVEVCLLDDDGNDVSQGGVGAIAIRSHLNFDGYWREPELSAATRLGDCVTVGDLGRFDGEGYLYLVGRKRDIIKSGGINVPAAEVEDVVARHPAVAEVACIGLPDRRLTEIICATVVLKPGASLGERELTAFCEPHLSRFQLPRLLVVVPELPKNLTGRVVKDELRAMVDALLEQEKRKTHV